jgi:hypothetical protein
MSAKKRIFEARRIILLSSNWNNVSKAIFGTLEDAARLKDNNDDCLIQSTSVAGLAVARRLSLRPVVILPLQTTQGRTSQLLN